MTRIISDATLSALNIAAIKRPVHPEDVDRTGAHHLTAMMDELVEAANEGARRQADPDRDPGELVARLLNVAAEALLYVEALTGEVAR